MVLELTLTPLALFEKGYKKIKVQLFNFSRSYLKICFLRTLNLTWKHSHYWAKLPIYSFRMKQLSVLFSAKGIFKFEILLLVNLAIESKLLTSIFAANFSMSHFTLLDDFNAKKSWWPFLKLDLSVLYFSGNFI